MDTSCAGEDATTTIIIKKEETDVDEVPEEDLMEEVSAEDDPPEDPPAKKPCIMKVVRIMTVYNEDDNQTYNVIQSVADGHQQKNIVRLGEKIPEIPSIKQTNNNMVGKTVPPALVPINSTTKKLSYKCFKCKACYTSQEDVIKHIRETHSASAPVVADEETSGPGKVCKICKICKAELDSSSLLYEHYKEEHDIDNPYLRSNKSQQESPRQLRCGVCGVTFTKRSGLSRHKRNFHSEAGASSGICHHCGNSYKLSALPYHEKKCITRAQPRRRQDCFYDGCNSSYYRKEDLIKHAKEEHQMDIEPMRTLKFDNEEQFLKWKENEEDRTFSYYSKHAGTKKNSRTYYCQHEGSERSHRSSEDSREKVKYNKKGRIKRGVVCTSYLRVKLTSTEVIALYYPTHSHPTSPDDLKYQPLPKEIIQYIKEQIALNVPCRQIQTMARKKLAEIRTGRRDAQVSLKRITSLAQRYHREQNSKSTSAPNVSVEAFNSFIDALCAQDDSPVIFYQPPSDNASLDCLNKEDHLFFLGLQTLDQQKMLQRDAAMPMFISVTKSDYTLQYYLITILVPCEKNFEYPVGHLISSQLNEEVVCLFLQTIGERCPELNVNCIVSLDCKEINSAIMTVFGNDGPYFLSKWHFIDFMRKDFLKTVPPNKVEELYDFILAMTEAENEDRFLFLYNSFKEQYDPTFPDIVSNFAEYFVRAPGWASCYRQNTGMIDSCLYADSFFNKLNKKYRRRPSKSINLLPDLLLHMQENYRDRREITEASPESEEVMREQHNMAVEIPSELVQEVLSRHWIVQASKHGQSFYVMQCSSKCYIDECPLKCRDCVSLCSHMYFCTCDRSESICLHVHKIHQMYGSLAEVDVNPEDASAYLLEQDDAGSADAADTVDAVDQVDAADVVDVADSLMPSPNEVDGQSLLLAETEVTRENVLKNLDALRQIVDQRCVPEETMNVINDTLESLCNLIGGS